MVAKLLPDAVAANARLPAISADHAYGRRTTRQDWLSALRVWIQRRRQRRALARLDDRLLLDVGISRSEAAREIAKPCWRR